ncbi:MAG: prepilin-type N-terminal cleavage/methylation domain-containing protein [Planctomycetes bacterium]|nr:prepilin-type N-terminal cleavage/methylation domain-containing protein [Planctomycetota bacterium]
MKSMRKGFTLVELMVVLAIIAILVGLSSYAVIYALDEANYTASDVLIENVSAGCEMYKQDRNNRYPKNGTDLQDHMALVLCLAGQKYSTTPSNYRKTYMELKRDNLLGNEATSDFRVIDAWEQPIYYANLLNTAGGTDSTPTGYSDTNWKNRGAVDIWSAAKDLTEQASGIAFDGDWSNVDDDRVNNWGTSE